MREPLIGIVALLATSGVALAQNDQVFQIPMAGQEGADTPANNDQIFNIPVAGQDGANAPAGNDRTFNIPVGGQEGANEPSFNIVVGAAESTLCRPGEATWFSANVPDTGKLVSICGSESLEGAEAWLDYRYGTGGNVELTYPAQATGSLDAFAISRYTRPRTTYLKFAFTNGGYEYAILEGFEADIAPASSAFLRVTRLADGTEVASHDLAMTTPPLTMMALENRVRTEPFDE